jgi:hypothetical protein
MTADATADAPFIATIAAQSGAAAMVYRVGERKTLTVGGRIRWL